MRAQPDTNERDRIIAEAVRIGMTRADASVLADVSKHAFEQAMSTAQRILDTCPPELRLPAFASVLASFATVMREKLPEHWAAFAATTTGTEVASVIMLPDKRGA